LGVILAVIGALRPPWRARVLVLVGAHRPAAIVVAAASSALLAWALLHLNWRRTSDMIGGVLLGLTASASVASMPILDRQAAA
jgi:hypothetical protein